MSFDCSINERGRLSLVLFREEMADADGVLFVTCMPLDAAGLVSNRSPYRPPSSSDIHVVLVVCILISASQSSCIASFAQFAVVRSLYEYSRRIIDQNRTDWVLFGVWCFVFGG
jgi:hypothetical protein